MNLYKKIKSCGIKKTIQDIYEYQIDKYLLKLLSFMLKNKPLQNIIVIESHNDFDSNGGAFYNYLISSGLNDKYKIVWLLKHPKFAPRDLPHNVTWVSEYTPSLMKNYYKLVAKYITSDQDCERKANKDQISIYMTHGAVGLKDCSGLITLPNDLNFCLTASDWWRPLDAKQYGMNADNDIFKICGYPAHDVFYTQESGDLIKIVGENQFKKAILWMPTFRKNKLRRDSVLEPKLGIPIINTIDEYKKLNEYLLEYNILLIVKIHPKQDISDLKIYNCSNIKVLTGESVKQKGIDNYRLMKDVDALISDYSSAAYAFLHCDKPIAYDLSDLESYTRGIIVDDPHEMMAGHEIKDYDDLLMFIKDINESRDVFRDERKELFDRVFKYHDGNSCKRVAELLKL